MKNELRFENACDDAAYAVLKCFAWLLPDDDGESDVDGLAVDLNIAIATVMQEWLKGRVAP